MTRVSTRLGAGAAAVMLITSAATAGGAIADDHVLLDGLAGPLGLAVGDDGTIYVGEAFGGKLTSLDKRGTVRTVVDAPGQEVAGVDAKGKGTLVFTQTLFDGEPGEEAPPLDAILGRVQPNGKAKTIASLQDFEIANNPDEGNTYGLVDPSQACIDQVAPFFPINNPGIVESHPYAVAIVPGGYAVADAAGNTILHVGKNGHVSTVAVLPPIEQILGPEAVALLLDEFGIDVSECEGEAFWGEPVPTDVEVGPDGHWYVSTLPGFPEAPGAGAVWRIDPATGAITLVASGLTGPVDIAVDDDGSIVVAELFAFQITRLVDGVVVNAVFAEAPGAVEIGRDGTVYATVGVFGPNGQVVTVDV